MFAMVGLASVPCTSKLSTGRRQSRASEARRGYAAHPRAGTIARAGSREGEVCGGDGVPFMRNEWDTRDNKHNDPVG
jgi:hypothetical protein